MAKEFESRVVLSLKRSKSLRTTVPEVVATLLGLEPKDSLVWSVEPGTGVITVCRKPTPPPMPKKSKRS